MIRAHKPKRADPNVKRRDFTDREVATLLAMPLFTGSKGYKFKPLYKPGHARVADWRFGVPLICLFSGMRLNEACALAVADIKEEDGVPYMHVRDLLEGQNAKSEAARRKVPIHHHLLEAGFLDFVAHARRRRRQRIFHDMVVNADGYVSDVPQKFFVHVIVRVVDLNVEESGKLVFHSTRHTVISKLRNLDCRETSRPRSSATRRRASTPATAESLSGSSRSGSTRIEYPDANLAALRQPTPRGWISARPRPEGSARAALLGRATPTGPVVAGRRP